MNPGADPSRITLAVDGASHVSVDDESGDLVLETAVGPVRQHAPVVYQVVDGQRRLVDARYVLASDGVATHVRFDIAAYDTRHTLVIDPVVVYATLLGGAAGNFDGISDLAVDARGNAYAVGQTESSDFPVGGALDPTPPLRNMSKAFVSKFGPDGAMVFSTFLGGRDSSSSASAVAVDETGAIFVAGISGEGFPVRNGFQMRPNGPADVFVAKLSPDGSSITYATYFGGNLSENLRDMALDADGRAYIAGEVSRSGTDAVTFPELGAVQQGYGGGGSDAFLAVLSAAGDELRASTLLDVGLRGSQPRAGDERVSSIVVDPTSRTVVMSGGITFSPNNDDEKKEPFLVQLRFGVNLTADVRSGGARPQIDSTDTLIEVQYFLGADLSAARRFTLKLILSFLAGLSGADPENLGGSLSRMADPLPPREVGVVVSGKCAIVPPATTCDEPLAFVILDGRLAIKRAANVPGGQEFFPDAVTQDADGNIYVAGDTTSARVPTVDPVQSAPAPGGSDDLVIAAYKRQNFQPAFVSYFGGDGLETPMTMKVDRDGNIYVAGVVTRATNFPVSPGAFQREPKGRNDGFLVKISTAITQQPR